MRLITAPTDTSYLRFGRAFRWWRTLGPEDTVTVAWQFTPDPDGEITFSAPLSLRRGRSWQHIVAATAPRQPRNDRNLLGSAVCGPHRIPDLSHRLARSASGERAREESARRCGLPRASTHQHADDRARRRAAVSGSVYRGLAP
ncbi:DUF5984 family protein [Nocardia sp. NPDC049526]|uniref:DUF5984 family protein n=1 Tax=Nocardia sp. NPDC049526 TaxID=3364316 RepID=UPI003798C94C